MISSQNEKCLFLAHVSKEFAAQINMKTFSEFIKEKYNLRGGGTLTTIQGGGPKISKQLEKDIVDWIEKT